MTQRSIKRLLLIGGGHSHVEVLRQLGNNPIDNADVTLVSDAPCMTYSGTVPGVLAGHYEREQCQIDLQALAQHARCTFIEGACTHIDASRRQARLLSGFDIEYDVLSLNVGSSTAIPGNALHSNSVLAVRPLDAFLHKYESLVLRARAGQLSTIAVVGGGAGGVEVLLAIQHRLQKLGATIKYILLTDSDRILPGHNRRVQRLFERILVERNIEVHLLTKVVDVNDVCITLESGQRIVADTVVYATGPTPWPWMHASGLAVDPAGFLMIDSNLQSISATAVFAAGDCAVMHPRDYPKSGVYAVRQGSPLARNLRSTLTNNSLSPYRPQARALALISTGDKRAVLSYGPLALEGAWVWRWKDGIDRTFVRRYRMSL